MLRVFCFSSLCFYMTGFQKFRHFVTNNCNLMLCSIGNVKNNNNMKAKAPLIHKTKKCTECRSNMRVVCAYTSSLTISTIRRVPRCRECIL